MKISFLLSWYNNKKQVSFQKLNKHVINFKTTATIWTQLGYLCYHSLSTRFWLSITLLLKLYYFKGSNYYWNVAFFIFLAASTFMRLTWGLSFMPRLWLKRQRSCIILSMVIGILLQPTACMLELNSTGFVYHTWWRY